MLYLIFLILAVIIILFIISKLYISKNYHYPIYSQLRFDLNKHIKNLSRKYQEDMRVMIIIYSTPLFQFGTTDTRFKYLLNDDKVLIKIAGYYFSIIFKYASDRCFNQRLLDEIALTYQSFKDAAQYSLKITDREFDKLIKSYNSEEIRATELSKYICLDLKKELDLESQIFLSLEVEKWLTKDVKLVLNSMDARNKVLTVKG